MSEYVRTPLTWYVCVCKYIIFKRSCECFIGEVNNVNVCTDHTERRQSNFNKHTHTLTRIQIKSTKLNWILTFIQFATKWHVISSRYEQYEQGKKLCEFTIGALRNKTRYFILSSINWIAKDEHDTHMLVTQKNVILRNYEELFIKITICQTNKPTIKKHARIHTQTHTSKTNIITLKSLRVKLFIKHIVWNEIVCARTIIIVTIMLAMMIIWWWLWRIFLSREKKIW